MNDVQTRVILWGFVKFYDTIRYDVLQRECDPESYGIVVVKSAIHFLADFEPIAETVLFAVAAGQNPCKLTEIPYKKLRSGLRLGAQGPAFIRPEH